MRRFILTGAPGSGKTTLIRALAHAGVAVVEEAASDIIALEQARGVDAPWERPKFIDDIVALQRERQEQAVAAEVQVFDRSPVCTYALCLHLGVQPTELLSAELHRIARQRIYEPRVLFIENLGFCEPTAARRISFEESLRFEETHRAAYRSLGYDCVSVPAGEIEARLDRVKSLVL